MNAPAGLRKGFDTQKLNYDSLQQHESFLQSKRGPHLAPTTEMGRNHDLVEHELANRESKKIGLNDSLKDIDARKRQITS